MSTYYFVPSRNVFGEGSVAETGHLMKSLGGTKAMIVTDEFLASNPMTTRIQAILKEAGVDSAVFGKAEPNPKDTNVVEGENFYHENRCDCILSLGGGSSHDCAKGIGLVASNGGKIADYEDVDKAHEALPPLVAVNTTDAQRAAQKVLRTDAIPASVASGAVLQAAAQLIHVGASRSALAILPGRQIVNTL